MNQKGMVHFEVVKNNNTYIFVCPLGAPIGESYDACQDVIKQILEIANQQAQPAPKVEEVEATLTN